MDVVTLSMAKAYTDSQRLAYTEGGKIMWDVELVPMEGTGFTYFQESNTDQTVLSVGKTYTVTTDSGSFTTVCKEMSGVVFLGNGSILGITGVEDSGENFLVTVDEDHVMGFFDFNGGSRMEISTAETIHPIDPKYLPGVCLPVVELTTEPTEDGAVLTAEESAAILAVGQSPFICKWEIKVDDDGDGTVEFNITQVALIQGICIGDSVFMGAYVYGDGWAKITIVGDAEEMKFSKNAG